MLPRFYHAQQRFAATVLVLLVDRIEQRKERGTRGNAKRGHSLSASKLEQKQNTKFDKTGSKTKQNTITTIIARNEPTRNKHPVQGSQA